MKAPPWQTPACLRFQLYASPEELRNHQLSERLLCLADNRLLCDGEGLQHAGCFAAPFNNVNGTVDFCLIFYKSAVDVKILNPEKICCSAKSEGENLIGWSAEIYKEILAGDSSQKRESLAGGVVACRGGKTEDVYFYSWISCKC